jgi:hypothetical protein
MKSRKIFNDVVNCMISMIGMIISSHRKNPIFYVK